MTSRTHRTRNSAEMTTLSLTLAEVDDLVDLADYYRKSMGLTRHFVRITGGQEIRTRMAFIAQESEWLERYARAIRGDMQETSQESQNVDMTIATLVAFWGRALSSLRVSRSHRKLRGERLPAREALERKLAAEAARLYASRRRVLDEQIQTRRQREVHWMRESLAEPV